jgi:hypothetical protein
MLFDHVYGSLPNRDFTSLEQLNKAVWQQLTLLNNKLLKKQKLPFGNSRFKFTL